MGYTEEEAAELFKRVKTVRQGVDRPPRRIGGRGKTGETRNNQKPDDSGHADETACPDCGITWRTARRRLVETIGGIEYDKFWCHCSSPLRLERYK